jgi:hypothetical protein
MKVYVDGKERQLHVIDRSTGLDYAKQVVCAQEVLSSDDFGYFCLTEEEYADWSRILAQLQVSEDMRFSMRDTVDEQELRDYLYEETLYLATAKELAQMEYICVCEVQKAIRQTDIAWLQENKFPKTIQKLK